MTERGHRILDDGCTWCGKSKVFCQSMRTLEGNCCGKCHHHNQPTDQLDHGTTTHKDTPGEPSKT